MHNKALPEKSKFTVLINGSYLEIITESVHLPGDFSFPGRIYLALFLIFVKPAGRNNFFRKVPCSQTLLIDMANNAHRYYIINKPRNMVSQFVSTHNVNLLGSLDFDFPDGTHAVGRLDNDSEGMLILTTNKKVTRLLFLSATPHKRRYLVQVNNIISEENLHLLRMGITIRVKEGRYYVTPPSDVTVVDDPATIYPSVVDSNQYGPHTWLLITLNEGKYHQVRKMMGAIHHRCKRLIRVSIEDLSLGGLPPGSVAEIAEVDFFRLLNLDIRPDKHFLTN